MCTYCRNLVTVVNDRLASHGSRDKNCRGSGAQVRGNWRDDPSFSEAELLADARRHAEASSYFAPIGHYRRMFND